jgi:hypothetical protein
VSSGKLLAASHLAQIAIAIMGIVGGAVAAIAWVTTPARDAIADIYKYEFSVPLLSNEIRQINNNARLGADMERLLSRPGYLYRINIRNIGRHALRDVRVSIEGGLFHSVVRTRSRPPSSEAVTERITGGNANIPEILPESSITVYLWTDWSGDLHQHNIDRLTVAWASGSAEKILHEYNDRFSRWLSENLFWIIPIIIIPTVVLYIAFVVRIIIQYGKQKSSRSETPNSVVNSSEEEPG